MHSLAAFVHNKLMPYTAKVRGDLMIKQDYYLNRLIHNMWNGEIKVITGIRRCALVNKNWTQILNITSV